MHRLMLVIALLVAATAPVVAADSVYRTEKAGACTIIYVHSGIGSCPRVPQRYYDVNKPDEPSNGKQGIGPINAPFIAAAFQDAWKGMKADTISDLRDKYVRIILVPFGGAAQTFTGSTGLEHSCFDIEINEAMVDLIDYTCMATMLDALKGHDDELPGMGFNEWMQAMRSGIAVKPGGRVVAPGPSSMTPAWVLKYVRVPAHCVYQFLFSHELAHVIYHLSTRSANADDAMKQEMLCDRYAFDGMCSPHAIASTSSHGNFLPDFIVNWQMVMWYYAKLYDTDLRNDLHLTNAPPTFTKIFPAYDFHRRAAQIVDLWQSKVDEHSHLLMATTGADEAIKACRALINAPPPQDIALIAAKGDSDISLMNRTELLQLIRDLVDDATVTFDSGSGPTTYRHRIVNINSNDIIYRYEYFGGPNGPSAVYKGDWHEYTIPIGSILSDRVLVHKTVTFGTHWAVTVHVQGIKLVSSDPPMFETEELTVNSVNLTFDTENQADKVAYAFRRLPNAVTTITK